MAVGGDFVDILYSETLQKLGLFICDVSGHGIPAAFVASMTKMALHSWESYIDKPAQGLVEIRKPLIKNIGDNFITACICCLDLATGDLTFASAGHSPIAVVRNNGDIELHQVTGRMIQTLFEPNYLEKTIRLEKNDKLILYTDGITETENRDNIFLGADDDTKFRSWISKYITPMNSPGEICRNIYQGAVEYNGSDNFNDDFTILVVEYTG